MAARLRIEVVDHATSGRLVLSVLARTLVRCLADANEVERLLRALPTDVSDPALTSLLALLNAVPSRDLVRPTLETSRLCAVADPAVLEQVAVLYNAVQEHDPTVPALPFHAVPTLYGLVAGALPLFSAINIFDLIPVPEVWRHVTLQAHTKVVGGFYSASSVDDFAAWTANMIEVKLVDQDGSTWQNIARLLQSCPKLRSITYVSRAVDGAPTADTSAFCTALATSQLRTLSLSKLNASPRALDALAQALLQSRTLTTLTIYQMPALWDHLLRDDGPSFPVQLASLDVAAITAEHLMRLVRKLTTTRLRTLHWREAIDVTDAAMTLDSLPELTSLTIQNVILETFPLLLRLRHLHVLSATVNHATMQAIGQLMATSSVLETVRVHGCLYVDGPPAAMIRALPAFFGRAGTALTLDVFGPQGAAALAQAMTRTRHTAEVTLKVCAAQLLLDDATRGLLDALAHCARMTLVVEGDSDQSDALVAHAETLGLQPHIQVGPPRDDESAPRYRLRCKVPIGGVEA
ncbi:hypothetical protein SPRG_09713 [Saprolegnia parasitica CBS 223.65]|uniref:Uncharacterized protein n=1 Tax=Saprolegnia parasitica (strain CBS 223.65) TaxID=695850 RepID=A0A067C368_SAPPC|nr:hypothetical protein SPRG_09713 [Saprolegnia parasitica CBS 223.65]KDO24983.1 hypothetical protein SPRG_09713 [Saprolegnia parasitica CBS 223.65]|eukprot:XP_012204252.1 hypothetical protein SPRG_09713 [Saprolegnia parasitica CBS 223.65]